jgi:hypothetical protein
LARLGLRARYVKPLSMYETGQCMDKGTGSVPCAGSIPDVAPKPVTPSRG